MLVPLEGARGAGRSAARRPLRTRRERAGAHLDHARRRHLGRDRRRVGHRQGHPRPAGRGSRSRLPHYGFARYHSYLTAAHTRVVVEHGPSPIDRPSWRLLGSRAPPRRQAARLLRPRPVELVGARCGSGHRRKPGRLPPALHRGLRGHRLQHAHAGRAGRNRRERAQAGRRRRHSRRVRRRSTASLRARTRSRGPKAGRWTGRRGADPRARAT